MLPGRKLEFLLNSKPSTDGAWTHRHRAAHPPSRRAILEYELWVEKRKQMVEKLSGGEIGYLHIKAMDAPSCSRSSRRT